LPGITLVTSGASFIPMASSSLTFFSLASSCHHFH